MSLDNRWDTDVFMIIWEGNQKTADDLFNTGTIYQFFQENKVQENEC